MFRYTTLAAAVATAIGALAVSAPAMAQQQSQSLGAVEITGSLIRRVDTETALPVVVIGAEELTRAGATNAEQAVKLITQQQGGTVTSTSVSGTNGAAAYASLRNLGAQRTLVLLNGKRVVSNPFASVAVDLNTLPMSAVSRVEVLTDGASATYGTDAIAGVINFITRREFSGINVGAEVQMPQQSGGEVYTGTLLGGFGSLAKQGWNVYGGLNFRQQEKMFGTDRDFSAFSYDPARGWNAASPTTFPANYSQVVAGTTTVVSANPSFPNCDPPRSVHVNFGTNAATPCQADTQGFTWTIPEQKQWSGFLRGALALGGDHTASLEYFRSSNIVTTQIAPSPEGGLSMPSTSPFYPGNGIYPAAPGLVAGSPISINWRTVPLGGRQGEQENITQRFLASLDGRFWNWDYQLSALWSDSNVTNNFLNGYPTTTGLRAGVAGTGGAPFLNPFGPQTPEGLAYLRSIQVLGQVQEGNGELQSYSAVISRQFGQLPGGPMSIALATELRTEEMEYLTDVPKVSQAASSGLAGSGAQRRGDRDITAFGIEMLFPLVRNVEFSAQARFDDYSDFGSTLNPKFGLKWTPTRDLLIRSSINRGFTAPTLTQLYAPNATTFTATRYNDPVLCPGGTLNVAAGGIQARDCGLQFQRLTGGNEQLQAERSRAFTAGFVFQATQQISFGADYWKYTITDNISTIGEQTVFGDPARYAALFVRCSEAPAARAALVPGCQQPGGDPLAYIIDVNQNLGETRTAGWDWQFNWAGRPTNWGRFGVNLRGTYVDNYRFQVIRDGRWFNPVDNYNAEFGGPVIRYQQVSTLNWDRGVWSSSLINRYQSGYFDQNLASGLQPGFRSNRVGAYSLWDVSVTYTGIRNLAIRGGILNVLDTDPPWTNQISRFQARAYDDRFHNPLGRVFTLGASYSFF